MSQATPPADGQTLTTGQTTGQTPTTVGQTTAQPHGSSEDERFIPAAKAHELREEAKSYRLAKEALEVELKKIKDGLLSEEQRKEQRTSELEKQNLTLQRELQDRHIESAVLLIAPEVGIKPRLALKVIDYAAIDVDAKTGKVDEKSVKKALDALLEEFPELAVKPAEPTTSQQTQRPPAPRVSATNPPASSVGNQPQYSFKNRPGWGDAIKK